MTDREKTDAEALRFFDELWSEKDPWDLDNAPLDQARYRRQVELLADRRYERVLEIGCGSGSFTEQLAPLAESLIALEISAPALKRAEGRGLPSTVELRQLNVMDYEPVADGPFDAIVISETIYYLGWLYPLFDIAWMAHSLYKETAPDGRLLLVNTYGEQEGSLMAPWLLHTYRDLFVNVGYTVDREETLRGTKETVELEILLTLFEKRT